jgi:hypothetical protein
MKNRKDAQMDIFDALRGSQLYRAAEGHSVTLTLPLNDACAAGVLLEALADGEEINDLGKDTAGLLGREIYRQIQPTARAIFSKLGEP